MYTFHLPEMIAFTFPTGKFKKSIMLLDGVTGEALKFEDDRLEITSTKTVVVKNKLYAFKMGSPVSAYKIANFYSNDHLVTTLSTLPRYEELLFFALSYWAAAGSIVLTGGRDNDCEPTAQTFLLDVQTGQWEQMSSIPNLTVARYNHSSMTLGKQAYVACGMGGLFRKSLSSVEMLRMGA